MMTRIATSLFTTALALSASLALAAPTESAAPLTAEALSQAVAEGTLDQAIADALGDNPSSEQLAALQGALAALAETSPADAAAAARAVVNAGWDAAGDNPQAAVDAIAIATAILTNPSVAESDPETVGQALAEVQGAVAYAQRAAEAQGITLTGTDVASRATNFAKTNSAVKAATPNFDALAAEQTELADAQAQVANFATAAGGADAAVSGATTGAALATATGVATENAAAGAGNPTNTGGGFTSGGLAGGTPGFASFPGGGGGGGTTTQTVASPAG